MPSSQGRAAMWAGKAAALIHMGQQLVMHIKHKDVPCLARLCCDQKSFLAAHSAGAHCEDTWVLVSVWLFLQLTKSLGSGDSANAHRAHRS